MAEGQATAIGCRTNPAQSSSVLPIPAPNPRGVSPHAGWGQSEQGSHKRARGGSCRTTGVLLLHT